MIDCGEGTQVQFRRLRLNFNRLHAIFISHLHGDHCFGLIGLISTLSLLGRNASLHIYAEAALEETLRPQIDHFCKGIEFELIFHSIDPKKKSVIYEDRSVRICTIPLRHRIPCCGFLFEEAPLLPHIKRDMIDFYGIPNCYINNIKLGADYTLPNGEVVKNERLETESAPARRYAYCAYTSYTPELAESIRDVNLLYPEATFDDCELVRARQTFHSTASQAAEMAKNARAKKLLIGHYSARYDEKILLEEAQKTFPATILAEEGLCINIE